MLVGVPLTGVAGWGDLGEEAEGEIVGGDLRIGEDEAEILLSLAKSSLLPTKGCLPAT